MDEILTVPKLARLFNDDEYDYMDAFLHEDSLIYGNEISIQQSIKLNDDEGELRICIDTTFEVEKCDEFKTTFTTYENTTRMVEMPNGKSFEGRSLKMENFDPEKKMLTKEERKAQNDLAMSIIAEMKAEGML